MQSCSPSLHTNSAVFQLAYNLYTISHLKSNSNLCLLWILLPLHCSLFVYCAYLYLTTAAKHRPHLMPELLFLWGELVSFPKYASRMIGDKLLVWQMLLQMGTELLCAIFIKLQQTALNTLSMHGKQWTEIYVSMLNWIFKLLHRTSLQSAQIPPMTA